MTSKQTVLITGGVGGIGFGIAQTFLGAGYHVVITGAIVNLASMLSYFGGGLVPAYSASKGGVVQLTKSLAIAWASDTIRVNAVAPGWIETELTRPLTENAARSDQILARTPLKRWGRPEDIGPTVLHLCSDASQFITGTVINIDGGYASV
jgi:NAD(P)-dependent dehydrogenase (short-subunit alcohol dehydrogenase family)